MKLSFRKSGGFAPVFVGCSFDTRAKADAEAAELESLVKASGIMQMSSKKSPHARDVFYYTFAIELDGKSKELTLDQLNLPESLQPLLNFLLERSKNMLPD